MTHEAMAQQCQSACGRVRRKVLDMAHSTGNIGAHLGGSLSMVELLTVLYTCSARVNPKDPNWEERDRIILSKGHAALALYPAMAEAGLIEVGELETFKRDGSRLGGHPSLNGLPGIEYASGSLGQGLSIGVGVSLALKRKKNDASRVFVLMGDGECDEGSVWEAAVSAAHFGLNNLVAVVDVNSIQYDGYTREVLDMAPFSDKWQSFGWDVVSIDGHNVTEIIDAYARRGGKPLAILARTVKGKGVSFMENNWKYHNASLPDKLYQEALAELGVKQ